MTKEMKKPLNGVSTPLVWAHFIKRTGLWALGLSLALSLPALADEASPLAYDPAGVCFPPVFSPQTEASILPQPSHL